MSARPMPDAFEGLLDYLKNSRAFDFTSYKRAGLMRRVDKRMQAVGVSGYTDYVDYLEVHPEEFAALFDTVLINVTGFFRDPHAWEFIDQQVLPQILARKDAKEAIRIWSTGCATGQEAYTLAMLLGEKLGVAAFRDRVKIYATDIDDHALNNARVATYAAKEVESMPAALLEKYFEPLNDRYVFHRELRRSVIFGRNDLVHDAPISRVDLLVCRNTLMYFNAEAQAKIIGRLHFALADGGYLFLGKAEMLLTHGNFFTPVDLKRRVFVKVPRFDHRERRTFAAPVSLEGGNGEAHLRMRDLAFDASPVAQIVVDRQGTLVLANDRARSLFAIATDDMGASVRQLDLLGRLGELRGAVDEVMTQRRVVNLRGVEMAVANDGGMALDVHASPIVDDSNLLGAVLYFVDATRQKRLQEELVSTRQELETAAEELESTNEELETTNEELQSANEELETTNEELQSTNEELETMNEELQSTNEELETINEEGRQRSDELNRVNGFLEGILGSLRGAVIVVGTELDVLVWNRSAEDMWGLRADEVQGKNLLNLDIGLPVDQLRHPIRQFTAEDGEARHLELNATNRRGKAIVCDITITPLAVRGEGVRGFILVVNERKAGT
jgi:two-component system CheB/CheR fusion protein